MSLINDALKKAQKEQSKFSSSNLGPALPPGYNPPAKASPSPSGSKPFRAVLIYLLGAGLLVAFSVGVTLYMIREPEPAAPPKTPPPVASQPPAPTPKPPTPPAAAPAPAVALNLAPQSPAPLVVTPAPTITAAPSSTPAPTPVSSATQPAPLAPLQLPASASKPSASAKTETKTNQLRIQTVIDRLQLNGVRNTGNEFKIILNNRLYRIGDVIDTSSGLKIVEVQDNHLVFTDSTGARYLKLR